MDERSMDPQDTEQIDDETIAEWTAPFEDWYYYPDHVIQPEPNIKGYEDVFKTDIPTVYQIPGDETWYMSFVGFNGDGYQSFVAESDDLVNWSNPRLAFGFGPEGAFDHGGVTLGAYLYESYDIDAPRRMKRHDGSFWSLYGAYPRQGEYETRPGSEGLAKSNDGITWERAKDDPILSVHQDDCGEWEQSCIYQPWLLEHDGHYYDFYNAANGSVEKTGLATSEDLRSWDRYEDNPVVDTGPEGSFNEQFSSDPKVYWDEDHWVMFFFGVGRDGAHIMLAFSRNLHNWTVNPDPIYEAGGHPHDLDERFAHKTSLVYEPDEGIYYLFYNAVGNRGRGIGLLTSEPLPGVEYPQR
ncbi:hypothetical protein OB955_22465 [Halobacteria archaeon AArc-m2/3/4]|uniref:Glycosyl hydrolase family 32 N-terminal domain-containing protein n=1 Tax=Natronoglomus mannanivorans TaxID=2979990 RepID=A0ABT2QKN7_9EURY|nr:hypothetical protein [Halobacteria archaeon AArc-m2/3/4]